MLSSGWPTSVGDASGSDGGGTSPSTEVSGDEGRGKKISASSAEVSSGPGDEASSSVCRSAESMYRGRSSGAEGSSCSESGAGSGPSSASSPENENEWDSRSLVVLDSSSAGKADSSGSGGSGAVTPPSTSDGVFASVGRSSAKDSPTSGSSGGNGSGRASCRDRGRPDRPPRSPRRPLLSRRPESIKWR